MAGPSYQTVPLEQYAAGFREIADRIFALAAAQLDDRHARQDKGSYSIMASTTQETVAKVVIYEDGRGKPMGNWPLVNDGVYLLVRVNGSAARNIWDDVMPKEQPWYFRRLDPELTIAVAPHHNERFAYFPIMAGESFTDLAMFMRSLAST